MQAGRMSLCPPGRDPSPPTLPLDTTRGGEAGACAASTPLARQRCSWTLFLSSQARPLHPPHTLLPSFSGFSGAEFTKTPASTTSLGCWERRGGGPSHLGEGCWRLQFGRQGLFHHPRMGDTAVSAELRRLSLEDDDFLGHDSASSASRILSIEERAALGKSFEFARRKLLDETDEGVLARLVSELSEASSMLLSDPSLREEQRGPDSAEEEEEEEGCGASAAARQVCNYLGGDPRWGCLVSGTAGPTVQEASLLCLSSALSSLSHAPSLLEPLWRKTEPAIRGAALFSQRWRIRAQALRCVLATTNTATLSSSPLSPSSGPREEESGSICDSKLLAACASMTVDNHPPVRALAARCVAAAASRAGLRGQEGAGRSLVVVVVAAWVRLVLLLGDAHAGVRDEAGKLIDGLGPFIGRVGVWAAVGWVLDAMGCDESLSRGRPWVHGREQGGGGGGGGGGEGWGSWRECLVSVGRTGQVRAIAHILAGGGKADVLCAEDACALVSSIVSSFGPGMAESDRKEAEDAASDCCASVDARSLIGLYAASSSLPNDGKKGLSGSELRAVVLALRGSAVDEREMGGATEIEVKCRAVGVAAAGIEEAALMEGGEDDACLHMELLSVLAGSGGLPREEIGCVVAVLAMARGDAAWGQESRAGQVAGRVEGTIADCGGYGSIDGLISEVGGEALSACMRALGGGGGGGGGGKDAMLGGGDVEQQQREEVWEGGMLYLALRMGRKQIDHFTSQLIAAMCQILEHYEPRRKLRGVKLGGHLMQGMDKTAIRWGKDAILPALWKSLNCDDEAVARHAVPAFCGAIRAVYPPGDGEAHRALNRLLTLGLEESRKGAREVYGHGVAELWKYMGAHAIGELGRGVHLCGDLGRWGSQFDSLALLCLIVSTCWPRVHAHMADVLQVALGNYHACRQDRVGELLAQLFVLLRECDEVEFLRIMNPTVIDKLALASFFPARGVEESEVTADC